ncbi:MAG: DEAD/DEAH box helicase [Sinobacterium sp.]|nr:DEAD/DEAH box helicase [Sinobacterium sp.]
MKFTALDFSSKLQKAIKACGYEEMTPIQEQAIPLARQGKDILANAQTGTGKTAAFALPILQQMIDGAKPRDASSPRTLILTPTRELAEQLAETIAGYTQFLDLNVAAVYGGVKMAGQAKKLNAGVDILIATPGRLLEHIVQCNINLSLVEFVVLDEADRMLDMGFIGDVQELLSKAPVKRQTLLFSATLSPSINELAKKILHHHVKISASEKNTTADTVDHVMYAVEEKRKIELFLDLLQEYNWFQVLVFTSTKAQADELLSSLKMVRVDASICHGDKTQGARRRAISDFKAGKIQVLIATEVAARGLDIEGLEYVVNYNLPYLAEDYVHRIGRSGRAGNKGHAISFVSREEERSLKSIENLIGSKIKRLKRAGYQVSSRETLLKTVEKSSSKARFNKETKTQIKRGNSTSGNKVGGKSSSAKPGKSKNTAAKGKKNNRK